MEKTASAIHDSAPLKNSSAGQMRSVFRIFAQRSADIVGSAWTFLAALGIIAVWGITGPAFHYSDTWQLIINTGTTIVTFLMVFLIQNTQNRDAKAIHLKLDELIRANKDARDALVDLEKLSDDDLKKLEKQFEGIRTRAGSESEVEVARALKSEVEDTLEERGVR